MAFTLDTDVKKILSDTLTPVSIYLKIRDTFPNSILLESSDYRASDNTFSYICCNPIAEIKLEKGTISRVYPDGSRTSEDVGPDTNISGAIHEFAQEFKTQGPEFKFINNGIFGYMNYDAVRFFEEIEISDKKGSPDVPDIYYAVYQNIIAIDHFKNETYLFSHCFGRPSNLDQIERLLQVQTFSSYHFERQNEPESNLSDEDFMEMVRVAKEHCAKGDVFQLVLSRRFTQKFTGDEFNVYRALRSINPSPYLFYFDYGSFKIFGSSPEAQLIVQDGMAEIHPIAGTFKRTGNDIEDAERAQELSEDEKENSEHVMLVDLARNDLSRHCSQVNVAKYKEVQFFSHVIHLVSKVIGRKKEGTSTMQVVADTFPAGTLSGAPKHMAMQLIERYENVSRGYYGGAIGFMDFEGNFNHAIMIRTFLSKDHKLIYQAGAGLVHASDPKMELQETYNKLGALNKALEMAEGL